MSSGPFLSLLRESTNDRTITRGRSYHRQRRVGGVQMRADGHLSAVVQGTNPYDVTLGLDADGIRGECSCPAWQYEGICKHVVALAILADEDEISHGMLRAFLHDDPMPSLPGGGTPPAEEEAAEPTGTEAAAAAEEHGEGHWRTRLAGLEHGASRRRDELAGGDSAAAALFELWIDPKESREERGLVLTLTRRPQLKDGTYGEAREANWATIDSYRSMPQAVRAALDRVEHLSRLVESPRWGWRQRSQLLVPPADAPSALAAVAGVVPLHCRKSDGEWSQSLPWSDDPWRFGLTLTHWEEDAVPHARLEGGLTRGERSRPLADAQLMLPGGVVFFEDEGAPLDDAGAFDWITDLRAAGPLEASGEEVGSFLEKLLELSLGVPLDLGDLAEPAGAPSGTLDLTLSSDRNAEVGAHFLYGSVRVPATQPSPYLIDAGDSVRILQRDDTVEATLLAALDREGATRSGPAWAARPYSLPLEELSARCGRLIEGGWQIEVESKPLRSGGALSLRVDSGIDWFDVHGEATFDEGALALPDILDAVRAGRGFVPLDDGGAALLPPDWTARLEALGLLSEPTVAEDVVRISRARAPLLDLLLADFADVRTDATFDKLRRSLRNFAGVKPRKEPQSFRGELRDYQREALGWFSFLRRVGLGGCLADDMGLGKTVQVLACLLSRRRAKDRRGPSLVVAPRSVMSNWIREAERFAPSLRAATYHGSKRAGMRGSFRELDLIVTTYGTMLRDIEHLSAVPFDYVVLDESQAIKNAASKTARAARLLDGSHLLALSGTPIENHLDELGSLFAFLNPGLLGNKREFQGLLGTRGTPTAERMAWLQAALRPVILRRTREQVLTELPEKEEQVLRCPLTESQRAAYEGIRQHYRASVLAKVEESGLSRTKMHVLEALLRLRQAACHPGLIDPSRAAESAAKLEQMMPMLEEISDAGHKALVFSQFTSFLSIVRTQLDNEGIRYEYMDGRTRNRSECIDRFQSNHETAVFLISLKAGGTGLNLTAAQYVFLLDPWWNPAVEAQAVGRAHRMGQTNPVTVYRLIGEDTVEDRVLELQARKRELVQAVLGGVSNAPLRGITRDDLELLLG